MRLFVVVFTALIALLLPQELFAMVRDGATVLPSIPDLTPYVLVFGLVLGTGNLTLADWGKRKDPNGNVPIIIELLRQKNEILDDMTFIEGNLETGHRTTVRTGLPAVAWRLLNAGVVPSKSTTAQIDEQCGMLEAWCEVDKDLALLNGNSAAFMLSEARAFIEAMNQEMAQTLFYGNGGIAPEEFTGLSVRYSTTVGAPANAANIIKFGGAGPDVTSIWVVAWGDETITGIFPKGSKAGLIHEDFGEVTVEMTAGLPGSRMRAYQERWQWKSGIALRDWRYVVRIANVDISDILAAATPTLIDALETAVELLPDRLGKPVIYMNRTVRRALRRQTRMAVGGGGGFTFENVNGRSVAMFGDIPIRTVDALMNTEALVP